MGRSGVNTRQRLWVLLKVISQNGEEPMRQIAEFVSVLACSLFTGAAVYVSIVEHPARMECGVEIAAVLIPASSGQISKSRPLYPTKMIVRSRTSRSSSSRFHESILRSCARLKTIVSSSPRRALPSAELHVRLNNRDLRYTLPICFCTPGCTCDRSGNA